MRKTLISLLALLASISAWGQSHFRFVVTGDGRAGYNRPEDRNGVNVEALSRLVKAIVAEKPALFLYTGDMVSGGKTDEEEVRQFKTFFEVMEPVYDAGIKVLAGRGNHETHAPHSDDLWRKVFSGRYANPGQSPDGGMTYAYKYGNSLFISLDEFQSRRCVINQPWLDKILASNKLPNVFVFAHKMAFRVGQHNDGMEQDPVARDNFMKSLEKAGVRTFFCGHDHLYDHTALSMAGWKSAQAIHQFVVGTAGAPFYHGEDRTGENGAWILRNVSHVERKIGYCVVDVDGDKVTVTFKAERKPGVFEAEDRFSYRVPKKR